MENTEGVGEFLSSFQPSDFPSRLVGYDAAQVPRSYPNYTWDSASTLTPTPGDVSYSESPYQSSYTSSVLFTDEPQSSARSSMPSSRRLSTRSSTHSSTQSSDATHYGFRGTPRSSTASSLSTYSGPHFQTLQPPGIVGNNNYTFAGVPRLWCECANITGCTASFEAHNTDEWIQHHLVHMGMSSPLPNFLCWFCDHEPFGSKDSKVGWENFCDRMEHIRGHILDDAMTENHMRPDFFVIKRLRATGEISEELCDKLLVYTELPPQFRQPRHTHQPRRSDHGEARSKLMAHDIDREDRKRKRDEQKREKKRH